MTRARYGSAYELVPYEKTTPEQRRLNSFDGEVEIGFGKYAIFKSLTGDDFDPEVALDLRKKAIELAQKNPGKTVTLRADFEQSIA